LVWPGGTLTPLPDSVTLLGLVAALVRNVSAAVRVPIAKGVKVTLTTQLALATRLTPQVLAGMAKSPAFAPVNEILVIVSAADPLFVSVTACVLVVATTTFPKERLPELKVTVGTGGVTPVPESVALSGLVDALVRNVSAADLAPSAVGVKVTLTTQLFPATRLPPQGLLEMA